MMEISFLVKNLKRSLGYPTLFSGMYLSFTQREWREQLKSKTEKTTENNLSAKSKKLYQTFKCLYVKQPSCIQAWNIQYNIQFDENEWRKLCVLPWKLTKDHKLIEFLHKILPKVFASQSYVIHFDRNVSERVPNVK